jgi:hypothetical protein
MGQLAHQAHFNPDGVPGFWNLVIFEIIANSVLFRAFFILKINEIFSAKYSVQVFFAGCQHRHQHHQYD